ncbi:transglutaminase-like cysteine peptidase [Rhizorhapis suberifaciens]|uniref:Putative transglutaminase-like cysteine proteinase n=1 Tax=Rhizorhapis suberifaciens TaxID=13656 RepID=A0A840HX57_9SPHN|nr:transglutaminase-like cysteine peptidase [Rhizorhapis suberifaciens]MBB4642149.1 putative transglutaminase-like cysteine proteinase [Rhizorhapis suberifaciens]
MEQKRFFQLFSQLHGARRTGFLLVALASSGASPAVAASCDTPFAAIQPAGGQSSAPKVTSKSEAVLQGGVSRLEQIRAQQGRPETALQPASFATVTMGGKTPMVELGSDCADREPRPAIFMKEGGPAAKSQIRPGQPDVFGTVALPVSRTALDQRWRQASGGTLSGSAGPWSQVIAQSRHLSRGVQIQAINNWVNARISYVEDTRQYGVADHWAPAAQSLARGRGDCEDFAIAKMQMLRALGIPASAMFLVIARDLVRRADHAVLAVAVDGDLLVLDNETDKVLSSDDVKDYRPVLTFNASGSWTHGYRTAPSAATLRYASLGQ